MSTYFEFPESIARPPGCPAGLLASDSGTSPRIELNHTAVKHWQIYSLLLGSTLVSAWAPGLGAGAGGLLGDSAAAGQLHPTSSRHDQLPAHH